MSKEYCASCSKELGFSKYTTKLGRVCWGCKSQDIDDNPSDLKGLRIGLGIVSVVSLAIVLWAYLS
jgi:hypothetical protein